MEEKILSVFIDESGDFGGYEPHCPYYIVTMVLHNQQVSIAEAVKNFDDHLNHTHGNTHAIHAGPLIRREKIYRDWSREERKYLFNALFLFAQKLDFQYISVEIRKTEGTDRIQLTSQLSKAISNRIKENLDFWNSFKKIIVYYDNGQFELTQILTSIFTVSFENVEFRKVKPIDYRLFQIADMVCTLELLGIKREKGILSKSEHDFFESEQRLKKNYLKLLKKKQLST